MRMRRERNTVAAAPATPGGRVQGALQEVVGEPPEPAAVRLAWASWERIAELNAVRWLTLPLLGLAIGLTAAITTMEPSIVFVDQDGVRYGPADLHQGALLRGNTGAELDAALEVGRRLVRQRFAYDPVVLQARLDSVYATATPRGKRVIGETLPREALARLVLQDSGTLHVREFGAGAYSYGEAPGRVRVVVPLTGRYFSRHVPFTGAKSGIRMGATVEVTLVKGELDGRPGWRLDSIAGEVLDSSVVRAWTAYQVHARPIPQMVLNGSVVAPDTAWQTAWKRGTRYANQN